MIELLNEIKKRYNLEKKIIIYKIKEQKMIYTNFVIKTMAKILVQILILVLLPQI